MMAEAQICRRLGRRGIACKSVMDGVFSIEHGMYALLYFGDGNWRLTLAHGPPSQVCRFQSKCVSVVVNTVDAYLHGMEEDCDEFEPPPGL